MYLNHSILFQVPAPLCCRTRFKEFNFSLLFHRVNYPPKDKSFSQSPTASDHVQGCPLKFTLPLLPVPLDPLQLFKAHPKGEDSKAQPPEFSAGLKKYYAHRFMLCKKTHLLAEGARSTSWTWCEKPQWDTPWRHLIQRLKLLRAPQLQPSCRKQLPHNILIPGHQALWNLHSSFSYQPLHCLMPESLGCIPCWFRLAACLASISPFGRLTRYNSLFGAQTHPLIPSRHLSSTPENFDYQVSWII